MSVSDTVTTLNTNSNYRFRLAIWTKIESAKQDSFRSQINDLVTYYSCSKLRPTLLQLRVYFS